MKSKQNPSSLPLPSCFLSAATYHSMTAVPPASGKPNLTATCLYHTDLGLFALTWSRNAFGRSFSLHLLDNSSPSTSPADHDSVSLAFLSTPSFHLHIRPFIFWNKHGSRKLHINNTTKSIRVFWDLSSAKFRSGPEPQSRFYISIVVDGQMILLVGDRLDQAYAKTRAKKAERTQVMVMRREHLYGNKLYSTKASFGGKTRYISIDYRVDDDGPGLSFSVDRKRVLQIKHLKWKFRGNEKIEVDGVQIQVSWDVYNWLFKKDRDQDGFALFTFRFEKLGFEDEDEIITHNLNEENSMVLWSQQSSGFGFEKKKRTARSSSSSSFSSASSGCSSVMEWESMEENELKGSFGFSLLVYAWKI